MKILPLLIAGAVFSPLASHAILIYGLTAGNGLVRFDSNAPSVVTTVGTISQPGIVDIDFYPFNGRLYGATNTGSLYRINILDASATLAVTASITGLTDIDFNPSADRVRIFGANDTNFRLSPDVGNNAGFTSGALTTDGTFSNTAVNLVGSAYTNNFDGVTSASTQLFSIDSASNSLFAHTNGAGDPAGSFNVVTQVGTGLGFTVGTNVGFDIGQDGSAYLSTGNTLSVVDLNNGTGTPIGPIGGAPLLSIAAVAVPEASTASVLLLTGLAALRRRRRA